MNCFDCPDLGAFDGRGQKRIVRARCCNSAEGRRQTDEAKVRAEAAAAERGRVYAITDDGVRRVVNRAERRQLARRQRLGLKP